MSDNKKDIKLKVVELFAGVGGFRIGLEGLGKNKEKKSYEIVWSNQWEPSTKIQHASMVYEARWGKNGHSNEDISTVHIDKIPEHDVLVGGFPCQDYSVATTLKNSGGLIGKKGVLWWQIQRILEKKKNPPQYLFFENVDRLLKSPVKQRGRDFAVMLKSLTDLGYALEWRVVNAADYGMPQRRRRVYLVGYHKSTTIYKKLEKASKEKWIQKEGIIADAFSVEGVKKVNKFKLEKDLVTISDKFNLGKTVSPFENGGVMIDGEVFTQKLESKHDGKYLTLGDILVKEKVNKEFYIEKSTLPKWEYLKGAKKEKRTTKEGFEYNYTEGGMIFPDALNNASRTIVTGEGGAGPSRFKHVVETEYGLRRLTPVELERLNMFPDNHTQLEGVSDLKRAFFMGNALVIGVVDRIGDSLAKKINN